MLNPQIASVVDDPLKRVFQIQWSDGIQTSFQYVWLRHHARLPNGMENDTTVKIDLVPDDPTTLSIAEWSVSERILRIHWKNDEIETRHHLQNLKQLGHHQAASTTRRIEPILWTAATADKIPSFDYHELFDVHSNLSLLETVRDYGLAKLKNVPTKSQTVAKVASKFGSVHVNNYGRVFDVQSDSKKNLGSNTGDHLNPHTDESYRHTPPGISLFHCLQASERGGESILVDGFNAANVLKQTDPDGYAALTTIPVFFQRLSLPDEDMQAHAKIISLDVDGNLEGIRFTDRTLPLPTVPEDLVEPLYRGIKAFWNIVNSDKMTYRYLMEPGDLHVFDNHRVLHGRTAFDPTTHDRHLQQCSVNRDEFHSSLRILAHKLGRHEAYAEMSRGALS